MDKYVDEDDCNIIQLDEYPCQKILIDGEGDIVFKMPETTPDAQMIQILAVANAFYDKGVRVGGNRKMFELRRLLEIDE